MNHSSPPPWVPHLLQAQSYQYPVPRVELLQTHISFVFLAGDFVYKLKKPVDLGFVDFSTLAKRRHFCHRELQLNRRLCPETYLGVEVLRQKRGGFSFSGDGEVVEYAVKMVRLPEWGMMEGLLQNAAISRTHLELLIDRLAPFYLATDASQQVRDNGRLAQIAANVCGNFLQTRQFVGNPELPTELYETTKAYAYSVLAREHLFKQRQEEGWIRDCHGDLYSGNICFPEKSLVQIFDCLEFNDQLRHIDILADVAFLAMDLEYHGFPQLAGAFIELYRHALGDQGLALLTFYKCYRAYVRGKVGMLTALTAGITADQAAAKREAAARYFQLALRYARQGDEK